MTDLLELIVGCLSFLASVTAAFHLRFLQYRLIIIWPINNSQIFRTGHDYNQNQLPSRHETLALPLGVLGAGGPWV
jgi:hypothetical protein